MRLTPVSRDELIRRLRKLGWTGPFPGKKHLFMLKGSNVLTIPNPHGSKDIGVNLLKEIRTSRHNPRRVAQGSMSEWNSSAESLGSDNRLESLIEIQSSKALSKAKSASRLLPPTAKSPLKPGIFATNPSCALSRTTFACFSASLW